VVLVVAEKNYIFFEKNIFKKIFLKKYFKIFC